MGKIIIILMIITTLLFSIFIFNVLHVSTPLYGEGCVAICYHEINNKKNFYSITPKTFENQIKYIKSKYNIITPEQLKLYLDKKNNLPPQNILITFDDVDESFYKEAFPILKKHNIPFTLFILTGQLGEKFNDSMLLTLEQLKEISKSDLATIGTHTHNLHYKIDNISVSLTDDKNNKKIFEEDILKSKDFLIQNLNIIPKYFAYPYGFGNHTTDEILIKHEYELIFSLRDGVISKNDNPFFIKRILSSDSTINELKKWKVK